jgi:hypothetical protein
MADGAQAWRRLVLAPLAAACLTTGCAGWWDQVTSRDYKFKEMFHKKPDPLVVLRDDTDGDHRARALRALKEPKRNGGTDAEQNVVVEVLTKAAATERQALVRLAAIHTLRDFKDPRVVDGLKEAYYRAGSYNAETATILRCASLEALGQTGQPAAVDLLVKVLREPAVEGPEAERQLKADERIASARALGHFNHYQATQALVEVLRNDKDNALRDRAHESLQLCTGKHFPPDPKVWSDFFRDPEGTEKTLAETKTWKDKALELVPVGWWK